MIEQVEIRRLLAFDITAAPFNASTASADNTAAIQAAIDAAFASTTDKQVLVPGGQFKHLGRIYVKAGVELMGKADFGGTSARSELRHTASNGTEACIEMIGNGPKLRKLWVTSAYNQALGRSQADSTVMVRVVGASNFYVERVEVQGGASAGIKITDAANNGTVNSNKVHDTLADGIHTVHGSHHITVSNNTVNNTGDDLISVVSYDATKQPFGICYSINIHTNTVSNPGKTTGRGISVVGGNNITIDNNSVTDAPNSGIYIVTETSYATLGIDNVTVTRNTVTRANNNNTGAHGGIFIQGRNSTYKTTNITIGNATDATKANNIINSKGQAINIGSFTSGINIYRNVLDTCTLDGIKAQNSNNLTINNNTIKKTGQHGIHFQSGNTGTCTVNNNQFIDINTSNMASKRVVYFSSKVVNGVRTPDNTFSSINVLNNNYTETVNYVVDAYIYYLGYTATVSGNTTTTGTPNNPV